MERSTLEILVLLALCGIGWIISLYFYLVQQVIIEPEVWWIPRFLQMVECRCRELAESYFGQTLGKSNAFWGLGYYALFGLLLLGYRYLEIPPLSILFILGLLAFARSLYLAWGLFILRVMCRPCLGVHTINGIIFFVLLYHAYPLLVAH